MHILVKRRTWNEESWIWITLKLLMLIYVVIISSTKYLQVMTNGILLVSIC